MIRNIFFYVAIFTFIFTSCAKEQISGELDTKKPILTGTPVNIVDSIRKTTVTIDHVHWEPGYYYLDFLKIFINFHPNNPGPIPTSIPFSSSMTQDSIIVHYTIYKENQEAGYIETVTLIRLNSTKIFDPMRDLKIKCYYGNGIIDPGCFPEHVPDPSATYSMAITGVRTTLNEIFLFDPTVKVVIQNDGGYVY